MFHVRWPLRLGKLPRVSIKKGGTPTLEHGHAPWASPPASRGRRHGIPHLIPRPRQPGHIRSPSYLGRTQALPNSAENDIRRRGGGRSLSRKVSPHAPPLRMRPRPTSIHHSPPLFAPRARPPPPQLPIPPCLPCASTPCGPPPCMSTRSTFLPPQVHPPPHPCFPRADSRPRRLGLHAHAALVPPDAQVEDVSIQHPRLRGCAAVLAPGELGRASSPRGGARTSTWSSNLFSPLSTKVLTQHLFLLLK